MSHIKIESCVVLGELVPDRYIVRGADERHGIVVADNGQLVQLLGGTLTPQDLADAMELLPRWLVVNRSEQPVRGLCRDL